MENSKMPPLGWAALASVTAVAGIWLAQRHGDDGAKPADGVVVISAPSAATGSPPLTIMPTPAANLPALPDKVIADVRQAYPLLEKVDFACDADGCAVTATIPPPTDQAFLDKRQEMLLGGLARTIEADGYQPRGRVQMDEVGDNLFHIRLSVAQAPRAK